MTQYPFRSRLPQAGRTEGASRAANDGIRHERGSFSHAAHPTSSPQAMRTRNTVARLLWGILLGTQGCFLPVPFNETASPPVVGFVRRSDGTPGVGWRVAVSDSYGDSTCAMARASAITDSAGRFDLPRTLVRRYGILLVPAFESFGTSFTLCSGQVPDSVMHIIYTGTFGLRVEAPVRTVFCSEWVWEQRGRIACSTHDESKVVEGGHWSADGRHGRYQVLLTEELGAAPGYRSPVPRPRAYVVWVVETAEGLPLGAVETVRLPIDDQVMALSRVDLLELNGRFYASLTAYRGNKYELTHLRFELGPPGQVTRAAQP